MKTFVEIGASDFNNLDHLLDEGWVGHFVEPIPFLMESLQKKIREQHSSKPIVAKFHQCAISDCNADTTMKYVDPTADTWVQWVRGLSAVCDPSNSNGIDTRVWGKDCIKLITVQCYTLDCFLDMNKINDIDLMQIDVEGHELNILRNYSWRVKPKQIRIEHMWCGWAPIRLILERNGYECRIETEDIWGELKEIT